MHDDQDEFTHHKVTERLRDTHVAVDASFALSEQRNRTASAVYDLQSLPHSTRSRWAKPAAALAGAGCAAAVALGAAAALGSQHGTTSTATSLTAQTASLAAASAPGGAAAASDPAYYYTSETTANAVDHPDYRYTGQTWLPASGSGTAQRALTVTTAEGSPVRVTPVVGDGTVQCTNEPGSACGWGTAESDVATGQGGFFNPTAALVASLPTDVSQLSAELHAFAEADAAYEARNSAGTAKAVIASPAEISNDELWAIGQLYRTGAVDDDLAKALAHVLADLAKDPASEVTAIANAKNLAGAGGTGYYVRGKSGDVAMVIDSNGRYIGDDDTQAAAGASNNSTTFAYGVTTALGKLPTS